MPSRVESRISPEMLWMKIPCSNLFEPKMASEEDLFEALKESLEKSGQLDRIKAEVRAEIFNALHRGGVKPQMPKATLVVNELIREYLDWSGYHYSSSVLTAESGLPDVRMERQDLLEDLKAMDTEETKKLPLLYSIISTFRAKDKK